MEIEGHPIPQDITGFQFKLIGDMTVKQFAFLGLSLVLGWLIFSLLPVPLIIKGPISLIVVLVGLFFAFAPVSGRSADTMVFLFFKALFKPNQFVYQKSQQADSQQQLTTTPPPIPQPPILPTAHEKPEEKIFLQQAPVVLPQPPHPLILEPAIPAVAGPMQPVPQAQVLEHALAQAKIEEKKDEGTVQAHEAHEKVLELEKQMQELLTQKQELEKHVLSLQQQLTTNPEPVFKPTETPTVTPNVKTVPPLLKKEVGVPIAPDAPNVITGIVKDSRGNVQQNILIEVKDAKGNPVRAFKTNPLGQFASATPLTNGTYTMTFEDPKKQQKFDTISIPATGAIMQPLEVTSVDEREELRKSLFQAA